MTMRLHNLKPAAGSRHRRKRRGCGESSGHGKTSGRGHNGQKARAGWSALPTFEGGQMPLVRRVPKRGFHNRFADTVAIVNLADLEKAFAAGEEVTPETLRAKRLARGRYDVLKVLGDGALTKALKVTAHRFSRSAIEKIQQAGGQAVVLPVKTGVTPKKTDEG